MVGHTLLSLLVCLTHTRSGADPSHLGTAASRGCGMEGNATCAAVGISAPLLPRHVKDFSAVFIDRRGRLTDIKRWPRKVPGTLFQAVGSLNEAFSLRTRWKD